MAIEGSDESFSAKLKVLKEQVEHHVKDEREELFPKVRKLLDKQELETLGVQLKAKTAQLQAKADPRREVPKETSAAATI